MANIFQTLQQKFNQIVSPYKSAPVKPIAKPAPKLVAKVPLPKNPVATLKLAPAPVQKPSASVANPTKPLKNTNLITPFINKVANTKIPTDPIMGPGFSRLKPTVTPKELVKGAINFSGIPSAKNLGSTLANSALDAGPKGTRRADLIPKDNPVINKYLGSLDKRTPLEKKLSPTNEPNGIEKAVVDFAKSTTQEETVTQKKDRYAQDLEKHGVDPKLAGPGGAIIALGAMGVDATGPLLGGEKKAGEETIKAGIQSAKSGGRLLEQTGKEAPEIRQSLEQGAKDLLKSFSSKKDITQVDTTVNTRNMNISPEAKGLIDKTVEEIKPRIEQKVGQTLTNNEAIDLANKSSKVLHSVVDRATTLKQEAAVLRLRQDIAAAAQNGTVDKNFIDNLAAVKSYGTHIARQLQALGINAEPKARTAKELIMDAVLNTNKNADEILQAAKGIDFNDPKQASNFYRQFIKPKAGEWIDLLRYNSMLSSPNTHIINTASNFEGTGLIAPIEKTITGGIDFLGSKLRGGERNYLAGEGPAYAKGYYTNIKNAAVKFADVMRGKQLNMNPDTRLIPLATKGAKSYVYKTLDFPLRALEAADQFFMTMTQAGEKAALEYKQGKGIKVPDNIDLKSFEGAQKRLFRGELGSKDQGHVLHAFDVVGQHLNSLRHNDNPLISTISKYTLPFLNTPLNILKQGIEYSPAGVITLAGNTTKTEQLSKIALGTTAAMGSAVLLSSGRTTWKEPTDPTKKAAFRAAGMQPYSIKIGDKWVSYSKLHPAVAFNLALVSALHDAEENKTLNQSQVNVVLNTVASLANFYVDQSYVKNIGDLVSSSQGDVEGFARLLSNYPTQLIPFRALSSWITRIVDPVQRQQDPNGSIVKKQIQQIMMQFPGLSEKVPARLGPDGQPIKNTNTLLNSFSPNKVTTENPANKAVYDDLLKIQRINKDSNESAKFTPLTVAQLKLRASQDEMGYTPVDKSLKSMGKTDRAKFFDQKLREAKTSDDVTKLLKEYSGKKLLTPDVVKEMIKLPNPTSKKGASLLDNLIPKAEAAAPKQIAFATGTPEQYKSTIADASSKNGVPTTILSALLKQESGFNPGAKSPVGATGMAQFMPSTAKALGINPDDPNEAIMGAAKYLKQQYDKFGSWDKALAAYNAGAGAVEKYGGIPPFAETQNYVKTIMGNANQKDLLTPFKEDYKIPMKNGKIDYVALNKHLDDLQKQIKPKYDLAVSNTKKIGDYLKVHPDFYAPKNMYKSINTELDNPNPQVTLPNKASSDPVKSYKFYQYLFKNSTNDQRRKINTILGSTPFGVALDQQTFSKAKFSRLYTMFPFLATAFFSQDLGVTPVKKIARPDFLSAFK